MIARIIDKIAKAVMLLAAAATVCAFFVLAFSAVPQLYHDFIAAGTATKVQIVIAIIVGASVNWIMLRANEPQTDDVADDGEVQS